MYAEVSTWPWKSDFPDDSMTVQEDASKMAKNDGWDSIARDSGRTWALMPSQITFKLSFHLGRKLGPTIPATI